MINNGRDTDVEDMGMGERYNSGSCPLIAGASYG